MAIRTIPRPVPGPGQVRVKVRAAAVQIADIALREGHLAPVMPNPTLPTTPGWEFAGVVDAVGDGVDLPVGRAVVGLTRHFDTNVGAQAEFVVVPAVNVALAPRAVTPIEAAGLPIALTAVQALDLLHLQ
ncbi:MAG: alcohol dehydrogenase catalytic domain-containing protein, partial [Chloroflexota bacterium]|nr:alcohol dehydrogenase catalytic domain-containing protein [Chloroflexota bacterium]